MVGVAKGLSHMHSLNVVHGDATLKNMLLCRDDIVKVADFGSAHSALGFLLGQNKEITTRYVMAPERWLGQSESAPPIDIWAWGVQLYMLHSGQCEWLHTENIDEVMPSLARLIGPIDEESWPGHEQLPK